MKGTGNPVLDEGEKSFVTEPAYNTSAKRRSQLPKGENNAGKWPVP